MQLSPQRNWLRRLLIIFAVVCMPPLTLRNAGAAPVTGEPLAVNGVANIQISPDSQSVVYLHGSNGVTNLYRVMVTGGPPIKLNSTVPEPQEIFYFQISPDSRYVVYQAGASGPLYSVPLDGSVSTQLAERVLDGFQISPDSAYVIYDNAPLTDTLPGLYSIPITGGAPTRLSDGLAGGKSAAITFDSRMVVYASYDEDNEIMELYSVGVEGGRPVKLGDSKSHSVTLQISPDGRRVVYLADQAATLYSVSIDGSESIRLNNQTKDNRWVIHFEIDSVSNHVVFLQQDSTGTNELYSACLTGGIPTKLNGALIAGGNVIFFRISPDGQYVVYGADQDHDEIFELYSVSIAGGVVKKLNPALGAGSNAAYFQIVSDSQRVVFAVTSENSLSSYLYSTAIQGGALTRLDRPTAGRGLVYFMVNPDAHHAVYGVSHEPGGYISMYDALYMVSLDGVGHVELATTTERSGRISGFMFTPDGQRTIYLADQDNDRLDELYASELNALILPGQTLLMSESVYLPFISIE